MVAEDVLPAMSSATATRAYEPSGVVFVASAEIVYVIVYTEPARSTTSSPAE